MIPPGISRNRAAAGRRDLLGISTLAHRDSTQFRRAATTGADRQSARAEGEHHHDGPADRSLDLGNRNLVLDTVRSLSANGLTIVLSTHEPEHAFVVADQVAILGRDRFVTGPVQTTMTSGELSNLYGLPLRVEQTLSGRSVAGPWKKDA